MGSLWLHALPAYLDKWGVDYRLVDGWETRSRSSGGFDQVQAIGIHHDASSPSATISGALGWAYHNAPDRPIGNMLLWRDGITHIGCAGAANTQGRGGPVHTARGTIGRDNANRNMVSIEAGNNGVGEPWGSPAQVAAYPRLCAAVLDWATHETPGAPLGPGDVFAHFEWAPGRKIDPAGQSPWATGAAMWNMDAFRGSVFAEMLSIQEDDDMPLTDDDIERVSDRTLAKLKADPQFRRTYVHARAAHRIVLNYLGSVPHGRNRAGTTMLREVVVDTREIRRIVRDYLGAPGKGRTKGGSSMLRRILARSKD